MSLVPARKKPEATKAPPTKTVQKPAAAKSLPVVAVATPPLPALSPADVGADSEEEQTAEVGIRQSGYESSGDDEREEDGGPENKEELDFNLLLAQMRRCVDQRCPCVCVCVCVCLYGGWDLVASFRVHMCVTSHSLANTIPQSTPPSADFAATVE